MRNGCWWWLVLAIAALDGCNRPSSSSSLESYPSKNITIICPWSAGGGTDRVSRYWAGALEKQLGRPCVVVNKTGGSGAVGHTSGANARADGHTITTITFELCTMHRLGITPLTFNDYECLLQMNADAAAIIVRDDAPWKSLTDLLEFAKENPSTLKMSGTATGGAWDLARAGLQQAAGIPVGAVIWVPKGGAAPSLVELLGGHIDAVCCSVPEVATQFESGQVRVLAVMSEERIAEYPELPTAREQGVDWVAVGWRGLALPKGTPPQIVTKLEQTCLAIAESDEFKEFMDKNRFGITIRGSGEFTDFLQAQDEQWKSVVEAMIDESGQ